jgi:hypothetical protein
MAATLDSRMNQFIRRKADVKARFAVCQLHFRYRAQRLMVCFLILWFIKTVMSRHSGIRANGRKGWGGVEKVRLGQPGFRQL